MNNEPISARVIILINEDGSTRRFDEMDSIAMVLAHLKINEIKTIVIGEINADGVAWEKQFNSITVMPSSFGKGNQS